MSPTIDLSVAPWWFAGCVFSCRQRPQVFFPGGRKQVAGVMCQIFLPLSLVDFCCALFIQRCGKRKKSLINVAWKHSFCCYSPVTHLSLITLESHFWGGHSNPNWDHSQQKKSHGKCVAFEKRFGSFLIVFCRSSCCWEGNEIWSGWRLLKNPQL